MATKIEWSDRTWNPWIGCRKIAPECDHCYAATFASRGLFSAHAAAAKGGDWTGKIIRSSPSVWRAPYGWPAGTLVFASSMTDFWHESVPLPMLDEALAVIDATPHLTYQILSKRTGNIARRLAALGRRLPDNVWLGATAGHKKSLPLWKPLLAVEASIHFLSCEPLLTPMAEHLDLSGIGWVIAGGESGRGARRCDPDWMRALRDRCVATRTPLFLKQWGQWENNPTPRSLELAPHAKGGATLDGRLWRDFPRVEEKPA